jgi:hypothetical protein
MGVISSVLVGVGVPEVMEETCKEHVQHFVEDHSAAEAFRGKSRHSRRGIPEQRAQIYHIGLCVGSGLTSVCPFSWGTVRVAAKGNLSSSS